MVASPVTDQLEERPVSPRIAVCPSCHTLTYFSYAGEQHWPEVVALAIGVETVMPLWHCSRCESTVSECEL